jgi:hypothetical protein
VLGAEKRKALSVSLEEQASPLRSALLEDRASGYFEVTASFAQRIMAIGKENKITQRIFSSNIRFLALCMAID